MCPRYQADMRLLDRPGSISTGCADSNGCNDRERRSSHAQRHAAARAGLRTRRAASTHRKRGPPVAGTPPSRGAEPSLPQTQHSYASILAITPATPEFSRSGRRDSCLAGRRPWCGVVTCPEPSRRSSSIPRRASRLPASPAGRAGAKGCSTDDPGHAQRDHTDHRGVTDRSASSRSSQSEKRAWPIR
jgi:hypothetical protein